MTETAPDLAGRALGGLAAGAAERAEQPRATVVMPETTPAPPGGWGEADEAARPDSGETGADAGRVQAALDGLRALATRRGGGGGGSSGGGRTRSRPFGMDVRNTWQIAVGSILVPLGVVFILLAWYGAAHTAYVQQQIPYLVSGSFAGVGCLVLGGLLYWAHWLYRIYDQADLHHEEQLRVLEQTLRLLTERAGIAEPAAEATPAAGAPAARVGSQQRDSGYGAPSYVVTQSGSVYHLPDCPVVVHHPEGLRSLAPSATAGLQPCRICLPGR